MHRLFLAALTLVFVASCEGADATRADWSMIQNRLWIEKMPKDPREMVKQVVLLDDEGERVGAGMRCSRFRWLIDALVWKGEGDQLRMFFLQVKEERKATVRAWNCKGNAPDGFELCLEFRDGKHKRTYYSMKKWEIDTVAAAEALVHELIPADELQLVSSTTEIETDPLAFDVGGDGEDESTP